MREMVQKHIHCGVSFMDSQKHTSKICDVDILRDDAVCYAQALRDAGVEVQESLYMV